MGNKKSKRAREAEKRIEKTRRQSMAGKAPNESKGIKSVQRHFRAFHDRVTTHHPQYVWGEKGKDYLTLGVTSSDKDSIPLTKNPEPGNTEEAHIIPKVNKINKGIRNEKLKGWNLADEDKKIANKIIDDYKKGK